MSRRGQYENTEICLKTFLPVSSMDMHRRVLKRESTFGDGGFWLRRSDNAKRFGSQGTSKEVGVERGLFFHVY
jgi:hypothetical protein